jgi:hypothetical protein
MNQKERDQLAYTLAYDYLLGLHVDGITPELVGKYLHVSEAKSRPDSIPRIYENLLLSAQNANMKAGVIGGSIGGVDKLGPLLYNFQPLDVLAKYTLGWEQILDEIEKQLHPAGKIRRTSRSIWPHYCQTILSAAEFLIQFHSAAEFYGWVNFFDHDDRARTALPLLLEKEIAGFGFALSCDFLKELGYSNYAKPDVHIRDIFNGLNLCRNHADDYEVFHAVVRVARNVGVTPYNADKLFWLIGSGYFYDDLHIGDNGRIGSHKADFIPYARTQLDR